MKIYTIYDSAAKYFMPIFLAKTDEVAQRMMIQSMGDQFVHRNDYALWHVGEFNDADGTVEGVEPQMILHGKAIPERFDPYATKNNQPDMLEELSK